MNELSDSSSTEIINSLDELKTKALELVQATRKSLVIFTPDMESEVYNHEAFMFAVLNIIKRSRQTEIRILTRDSKAAIEQEHQFLKLLHYSDGQFQIKKLTIEATFKCAAYLIGDDNLLLRRQRTDDYRTLCYTNDRARTKIQLEEFESLWKLSSADPSLGRFLL